MTPDNDIGIRAVQEFLGEAALGDRLSHGPNNEQYVLIEEAEFETAVSHLAANKFVLISLFCCEGFSSNAAHTLFYVFERRTSILVLVRNVSGRATSIACIYPSACWFERECRDGFGVEFDGAFDTRRLFLHETYPEGFHPLKKSFRNAPVVTRATIDPSEEYPFRQVSGEGVYQVPVGPVHAGIIEPGHFRFSVIGETIFNLECRMFYKHRGIEKLAEGKLPRECLGIAEAVSGDESVANATAFCMAIEQISRIQVPERAWYLRTILLELERIHSHLGDQAGMLVDVAFPLGANQFSVLREECFRENDRLTGSRFLRNMVSVGGLSRDIAKPDLDELAVFVHRARKGYKVGLKIVLSTASVIDRFATTGVIRPALLRPLNITGPAARASGGKVDVRLNHPYGIYEQFAPKPQRLRDGDVLSRFTVKASEIMDSFDLIERLIAAMPEGEIGTTPVIHDGYTLAQVESARGQNLCWVWIKGGVIERYKVRTASFCNWLALEHAVQGNIVPDFPVINKSLNLSYAGTDL
ncbi:MAG: hydrogenase [Methanomicrobiales archaeon HGW-Methanomicrobiales-1]|jgi:Ni,Fe-hydrogenase III large subunit/Ni,Fe-hydrogenase III component G|nr:MAG: hydrogenase [Methanomicrobiales archaeon HGW-Methanomicrobiales-1]